MDTKLQDSDPIAVVAFEVLVDIWDSPEGAANRIAQGVHGELATNTGDPFVNNPTGELTLDARYLALSRASLAARIKHGVKMSDLVSHIETLTEGEEALLSKMNRSDRANR